MSNPRAQTPIILGRPFLTTANAIINCRNGSMRLTFGYMTREVNVFNLEKQPRKIRNQTFEVNFVENNCDEESEGIENKSLFLDELFNECDYINEKAYIGDPNFRVPFKKKKFDLTIFTFDEPTNDILHENIIQEPPIDLLFKNLFEEELICLDEPTRDILVSYTPPGENVDLNFKEMYGTELESDDFNLDQAVSLL